MKNITKLFFAAAFLTVGVASAQSGVGVGTTTPDTSSALDITSTTKGFLMPRMTTTERTAIATPASGLQVYDTTTNTQWYYNGTAWVQGASATTDNTNDSWVDNAGNTVLSTGNVGIGTITPGAKLEIYNLNINGILNLQKLGVFGNGGVGRGVGILFGAGGSGSMSDAVQIAALNENNTNASFAADASFIVKVAEPTAGVLTERFRISSNGNVGIGTKPSERLHIQSSTNNDAGSIKLRLQNLASNTSSIVNLVSGNVDDRQPFFAIETRVNNSGAVTEKMRILHNGNVGIGTTAPAGALHVQQANGNDSPNGAIVLSRFWASDTNVRAGAIFETYNSAASSDQLVFNVSNTNSPLNLSTSQMVINTNGNVGIGTTAPTSKLQVVGLPVYVDNAAAITAGLTAGAFYHAGDGVLRVVF